MSARKHLARVAAVVAVAGLLSCAAEAEDPRAAQFAQLPDWRGVWVLEGVDLGISGQPAPGSTVPHLLAPEGPWNEIGRARLEALWAAEGNRKSAGWGYPLMMDGFAPLQFLITPEETLIINSYRDIRHVYTDGRDLPPEEDRWPSVWGESVGRWEGDTLVIETVAVQEPHRYLFVAPPFSEQARYTERLRKSGPDRIESQMTIEDPQTLTRPWTVSLAYTRAEGLDRLFHDAFENDRSELEGDTFTIAPPQTEP